MAQNVKRYHYVLKEFTLVTGQRRRLEDISRKGRYNTENQMKALCINNDNRLFGQLIKLRVLWDECNLVTKTVFVKDFFISCITARIYIIP